MLLTAFACVPNRKIVYLQDRQSDQAPASTEAVKSLKLQGYQHRLQPGDIISVNISSLTQDQFNVFNKQSVGGGNGFMMMNNVAGLPPSFPGYTVSPEGTIELTAVGPVKVGGLSITEAQASLKQLMKDYLKDPVVEVKLVNFTYTLLGEVAREGTFITGQPQMTIMQAIAAANGLTEIADYSRVKIIRHENGVAKVFYVNVLEDNLISSDNYYLRPHDVIVVAPLKARNVREYFTGTRSLFSIITGAAAVVTTFLLLNQRLNN
ncbi:MAG: polysaccharide biosynthesis/export family protein [Cytophagales bacterium]|nr:polysaccharide biosynthesis/export family protein [Cytophagales bacterium]